MSTASLCTSTITDYFLTIHLYFVYCVSSLQKRYIDGYVEQELKFCIPTKAELSISGGSIDCCTYDHTEAGEPSTAG